MRRQGLSMDVEIGIMEGLNYHLMTDQVKRYNMKIPY